MIVKALMRSIMVVKDSGPFFRQVLFPDPHQVSWIHYTSKGVVQFLDQAHQREIVSKNDNLSFLTALHPHLRPSGQRRV